MKPRSHGRNKALRGQRCIMENVETCPEMFEEC
jgi:hypothetical protein